MTTLEDQVWGRAKPKVDRYGYWIKPEGGTKEVRLPRVTAIAGKLEDRYHLERYGQRMVARGLVEHHHLYARVAATRPDDKDTLNQLCEEAQKAAKASSGADEGTALHEGLARIHSGEDFSMPPPWDADIAAYEKAMEEAGAVLVPGMVERVVVLPDIPAAGTFDRIYRLPGVSDLPLVTDIKTGSTVELGQPYMSTQLAMYSRAKTIYDPATCTHQPMPEVDQRYGLVIHLPTRQGHCTLYVVELEPGWEAVPHAVWARKWCYRKDLLTPLVEVTAPPLEEERRETLVSRITALRDADPASLEMLAECWPSGVPSFRQAESHTAEELDLIAMAISTVEAKRRAPFGPLDPADDKLSVDERHVLAARLQALPSDLRPVEDGVTGLSRRDGPALEQALAEAEAQAARRASRLAKVVEQVSSDDELVRLFLGAAGINGQAATEQQVADATALLEGLANQVVHFDQDDRGWFITVDSEATSALLLEAHGSRSAALTFCKEVARSVGRPVPRSFAAVTTDIVLTAYACSYRTPD